MHPVEYNRVPILFFHSDQQHLWIEIYKLPVKTDFWVYIGSCKHPYDFLLIFEGHEPSSRKNQILNWMRRHLHEYILREPPEDEEDNLVEDHNQVHSKLH